MAYPEPTPALKNNDAREILRRLRRFKLTKAQKDFYKNARADYERSTAGP
jgi:hypothetical protein